MFNRFFYISLMLFLLSSCGLELPTLTYPNGTGGDNVEETVGDNSEDPGDSSEEPGTITEPGFVNSIISGNITFYFDGYYPAGQFVDGQWWVHNNGEDVVITSMSPESFNDDGRVRHGAEVNPLNESTQGFDGIENIGVNVDMGFRESKNVDPGATGSPLILAAGNSVVKAISREEDEARPILSEAAILTILSETPEDNSFRPPYVGTDKTIIANLSDLNYDVLGKFEPLETTPHISEYVSSVEGVWLDHNTEWTQRDIHPESSMPVYGRELAKLTGLVGLQLQLDYTDAEKEAVLVAMVQYAIDIYGVLQNEPIDGKEGYYWYNSGGHNQGRKLPILIAGLVLDHPGMLAAANAELGDNLLFQDDQQTFYVSQYEVDYTQTYPDPDQGSYITADIGLAEWGIRPWDRVGYLDSDWGSRYRTVTGNVYVVTALAVRMMGATEQWNWPSYFDYADRYYSIQKDDLSDSMFGNSIIRSAAELWDEYRSDLGANDFD